MDGENGDRSGDGTIGEWDVLGDTGVPFDALVLHGLASHDLRRLDGFHRKARGRKGCAIAPSSRADVGDRTPRRKSQVVNDGLNQTRIGAAVFRVPDPDPIVFRFVAHPRDHSLALWSLSAGL